MTYNILGGWQDRISLIIDTVLQESPDYLVINEANALVPDIFGHLENLGRTTALVYSAAAPSGEDTFHVLLLSRKPFKYVQFLTPLIRAGLFVIVDSEFNDLVIVGTHLTPFTEDERLAEIQLILEAVKDFSHVILLGDFNALSPQDDLSQISWESLNKIQRTRFTRKKKLRFDTISEILSKKFIDAAVYKKRNTLHTTPTAIQEDVAHTNMRLDYIFISSHLVPYLTSYKVVKNKNTEIASDHYPILIDIKKHYPEIDAERNKAIDDIWFGFTWNVKNLWKLHLPVEEIPLDVLLWHLTVPLWEDNGKSKSLTPQKVINNAKMYPKEYAKIMKVQLSYPVDIMLWNNRWMLLDGVHRLAKAVILGHKTIQVRKVPHHLIPEIRVENFHKHA